MFANLSARTQYLLILALLLAFPLGSAAATRQAQGTRPLDLEEIDAFVLSEMEQAGIPGLSLAIVRGEEVLYLQGYGRADVSGRPVTPQTPFIIGSVAKTFTALAIKQLAASGQIDLDAPVRRYLPDFRLADPQAAAQITVQQLIDHTSGIPKAAGEQAYQLDPRYSTVELVQKAATIAPNRPVGAAREYSNVNYLVLGLVVEAVSGQSYMDYVRAHIWAPLDMRHSYFSEEEARAAGMATGYRTVYGLRIPADAPFPPGMIPCGYAIASAEDLSHYLLAYLNGGRYGSATVLDASGMVDVYWNRLRGSSAVETSQSGGTLNFKADIHMLPSKGVGVAVLTNTRHLWDDVLPVATAATIASALAHRVAGWPVPEVLRLSLWQSYLLLDMLGLLVACLAVARLWATMCSRSTVVNPNRGAFLPTLLDVVLAMLLLAGIPWLSGQRWDYLLRAQPDLAGLVFVAAVALMIAGLTTAMRRFTARGKAEVSHAKA